MIACEYWLLSPARQDLTFVAVHTGLVVPKPGGEQREMLVEVHRSFSIRKQNISAKMKDLRFCKRRGRIAFMDNVVL
jgi:hypothetical protein